MKKQSITISVPNNTTKEEIKEIRQLFKNDELTKSYKLNIFISGEGDIKKCLANVLIEKIRNLKLC
jgi:hypothetical protein